MDVAIVTLPIVLDSALLELEFTLYGWEHGVLISKPLKPPEGSSDPSTVNIHLMSQSNGWAFVDSVGYKAACLSINLASALTQLST